VRDVLVDAERRLERAGVPSPSFDSGEILAFVLGTTRSRLLLLDEVTDEQKVRIEQLLAQRLSRVPLQHLLGTAAFRRIDLEVGPGVFIPRPETELVTEAAIRGLGGETSQVAVDLCSGSGAIALSLGLEVPGVAVHAVESDDEAISWTRRNVDNHAERLVKVGSSVTVHHGDAMTIAEVGAPLARLAGQVAVVVSNPPYIPAAMVPREPEVRDHEPSAALYGGDDGLDVIRGVARAAAVLLQPGGLLVIEHADVQGVAAGSAGVPGVLESLLADADLALRCAVPIGAPLFTSVIDRTDLNGLPRFTMARRVGGDGTSPASRENES